MSERDDEYPEWGMREFDEAEKSLSQPAEPEPLNVRIARIAGWENVRFFGGVWWGEPNRFECFPIPDYEHDPAFAVRMMEANGLSVFLCHGEDDAGHKRKYWNASTHSMPSGKGSDPIHAVCDWIVLAAAAGVAIRWEV